MTYWIIIVGILLLNMRLKKSSAAYLWIGFYLFCTAASINILSFISISEFIMRVSFTVFLIGFILMVKEYLNL